MPYNKKSLENLKPFKKGEKRSKEFNEKAAAGKRKKATMNEIARAVLDANLPPESIKKLKEIYPDLDETHFTTRMRMMLTMLNVVYESERDSDKIAAFNTVMAYAGETPETELLKKAAEAQKLTYEDDPFSKSIKELLK